MIVSGLIFVPIFWRAEVYTIPEYLGRRYNVGGIGGMVDRVHDLGPEFADHFKLVRPADTETPYPWPGILFGLALVQAPGYWLNNQAVLQRAFGARSEFEVKAAMI